MNKLAILAAVSAAVLASGAAAAQTQESEPDVISVVVENDLFAEQSPDRHYSNGFQASYLWGLEDEPDWAKKFADLFPPFTDALDVRFEASIGQKMFTPDNLSVATPPAGARPYAGLLYATLGMVTESDEQTLDQLQVLIGVVGPSSGADVTQRAVHRGIGAAVPQGWETQIPDQFAWQLRWSRSDIIATYRFDNEFELELSPNIGVTLGNLNTDVSVGASVRFGPSLPREYGVARVYPSMPGSGFFEPRRQAGWYVFAGATQRYVAASLVLDERNALGNRVDKENWVSDAQLGYAFYWDRFQFAYTQVWRSREFRQQDNDWDSFGALSIAIRY